MLMLNTTVKFFICAILKDGEYRTCALMTPVLIKNIGFVIGPIILIALTLQNELKMKSYILLVTLLIIIFCRWSSASNTELEQRKTSMMDLVGRRLRNLWTWIWNRRKAEDTFVGRCFGVARRLKFAMPMIIFKLGVIVTILGFLTIFSLKTLGLLFMLVLFNSTGIAAKWAQDKHSSKPWSQPQNVHFHVHSKDFVKDGHSHADYDHDHGWFDRSEGGDTEYESLEDRLKKLNVYENYYKKY